MPKNIRPRYSPIIHRKSMMIPEKKQMAHIMEGQPMAMDGTSIFLMMIPMAPRILSKEKK